MQPEEPGPLDPPSPSVVWAESLAVDPGAALAEVAAALPLADAGLVLAFVGAGYPPEAIAAGLSQWACPGPVIGCTTAGQLCPAGYRGEGVLALAFRAPAFRAAAAVVPDLHRQGMSATADAARRLQHELRQSGAAAVGERPFGLVLVDGLCRQEEAVAASLHQVWGEVPVIGGSAGDGMAFRQTFVFADGQAWRDAAVLVLAGTERPFVTLRSDHFVPTGERLVVTWAETSTRRVGEINADPAAAEYARLVGVAEEDLTPAVFAANPLIVRVGGESFVRAIQRRHVDGSLEFACAIDEGMVLKLGEAEDLVARTVEDLEQAEQRLRAEAGVGIEAVLAFDSALRRVEAEQGGTETAMADIFARFRVLGFSTYGEQFHGMHVNHSFTGLAVGGPAASAAS